MSLYDSYMIDFEGKPWIKPLAIVIALILFLIAVYLSLPEPNAIETQFLDNPLKLKEKAYTLLEVKVTNVTDKDANNVIVEVEARDKNALFIGPEHKDSAIIPKIEHNQYRKLYFLVVPSQNVREGSYIVDVTAVINEKAFTKQAVLIVKPSYGGG